MLSSIILLIEIARASSGKRSIQILIIGGSPMLHYVSGVAPTASEKLALFKVENEDILKTSHVFEYYNTFFKNVELKGALQTRHGSICNRVFPFLCVFRRHELVQLGSVNLAAKRNPFQNVFAVPVDLCIGLLGSR